MLNPGIWIYLLIPLLATLLLGIAVGFLFTAQFVAWALQMPPLTWLESLNLIGLATILATLVGWLMIFSLMYLLASLITGIYLVPILVRKINRLYYPTIQAHGNDSMFAGLGTTLSSVALFVFWWLITMPLWLIPGLVFILPPLLIAWMNRRLYTLDVLIAHATTAEIASIRERESGNLMLLGLLYGMLSYVPILNLIISPLTALGYIHFCMGALLESRQNGVIIDNIG